MTTQTMTRKYPFKILLMVMILFAALLLLGVVLPPLNQHARDRHAGQAARAYNHVKKNGGDHCRWECSDGRIRYVCPLDNKETGGVSLWAVVVLAGSVLAGTYRIVTAFICRQSYAYSIREQGTNPWHLGNGHP